MTFEQNWLADSGAGFSDAAALDIDFSSFDPALIEALPSSIPDFFLVPPLTPHDHATFANNTTTDTTTDTSTPPHPPQTTQQPLDPHMLHAPQPDTPSTTSAGFLPPPSSSTGDHSIASSPSDGSPRALPAEGTTTTSNSSSQGHGRAGAGRQSLTTSARRDPQQQQADEDPDVVLKRQRNTIAARKYRQKRLDRIKELEDALAGVTAERDDLRLRLARQEAETAALREMMQMKGGQSSSSSSKQ